MASDKDRLSIEVRDLAVSYGEKAVLEHASFDVNAGSVVALLGPNGSGKTSLLLAMGGLMRPAAGSVLVGGRPVSGMKPSDRAKRMALLPQGLPSFIPFSVYETVLMGRFPLSSPLFFHGRRDREETEKILKSTDLWHLRERKCSELSGGEVQRVMLASVFAQETPVLLLDEPTASMDIHQQGKIMSMVSGMAAGQKRTVVIATHDLNFTAAMCDRVVMLMARDEILFGDTQEMLREENISRLFDVQVESLRVGKKIFFLPGANNRM